MGISLRFHALYRVDHGLQCQYDAAGQRDQRYSKWLGRGYLGAGAGLAADSSGHIYFLDANGTFDTTLNANGFPINGDFGNAFIKLSSAGHKLAVADYFTMSNTTNESNGDLDLGSGGALVLPDMTDANGKTRHLAIGAGKDNNIYLVDRDNMGKFNPQNDSAIYQELDNSLPGGIWSMPAYYSGQVYFGAVNGPIRAFQFTKALLSSTPASLTATNSHIREPRRVSRLTDRRMQSCGR